MEIIAHLPRFQAYLRLCLGSFLDKLHLYYSNVEENADPSMIVRIMRIFWSCTCLVFRTQWYLTGRYGWTWTLWTRSLTTRCGQHWSKLTWRIMCRSFPTSCITCVARAGKTSGTYVCKHLYMARLRTEVDLGIEGFRFRIPIQANST